MGRIVQPKGSKGSLRWIQHVVNVCPDVLNASIGRLIGWEKEPTIEWLSPRAEDDYAEYRDQAFLDLLGASLLKRKLKNFWPSRGPQWDALGRIDDRAFFLVEAKARVSEVVSSSQAKAEASRSLITQSLEETRDFLKLKPHGDPSKGFYQYANRLAHLYLLRGLNGIPAFLVFVYFVNDHTHVRTTEDEWNGALQLMHCITGTQKHKLTKYIVDIFVDVPTL